MEAYFKKKKRFFFSPFFLQNEQTQSEIKIKCLQMLLYTQLIEEKYQVKNNRDWCHWCQKPQKQTQVCAVVVPVSLRHAQCSVLQSSKPADKLLCSPLRHTDTPGSSDLVAQPYAMGTRKIRGLSS